MVKRGLKAFHVIGLASDTLSDCASVRTVLQEQVERKTASPEIIAEVRDVLGRPRVQRQFPALTSDLVDRFVAALERQALVIPEVTRAFAYERDPKDEPYINLAIAAEARYLVSRDTDILDLAKPTGLDGVRLPSFVLGDAPESRQ